MLCYATPTPVCIRIEFELYMKTILLCLCVMHESRLTSFDKRCSDMIEDGWMDEWMDEWMLDLI